MRPAPAAALVLATLVALTSLAPVALAAPGVHAWADSQDVRAGVAVTDDHLDVRAESAPVREARSMVREAAGALRLPVVGLDVLLVFTQPALRGESDIIAVVGVAPTGDSEWRGLHWVESSDGATLPEATTIAPAGRLFLLHAPANASGETLRATYHFLGPNGTEFALQLPDIAVLDEAPLTGGAVLGAAATSTPHRGLPDLVVASVWNAAGAAVPMGVSLLDRSGHVVADSLAGGCTPSTYDERASESGCRAILILDRQGRELVAWHEAPDGQRVRSEPLLLRSLDRAPYVRPAA